VEGRTEERSPGRHPKDDVVGQPTRRGRKEQKDIPHDRRLVQKLTQKRYNLHDLKAGDINSKHILISIAEFIVLKSQTNLNFHQKVDYK
jgi:hypothetical protein